MGPGNSWTCKGCGRLTPTGHGGFCTCCINEGIELLKKKHQENAVKAAEKHNSAILRVSFRLLERLFGLDCEHSLVDVIFNSHDQATRCVRLVVQGPKMYENGECFELPQVTLEDMLKRIRGS